MVNPMEPQDRQPEYEIVAEDGMGNFIAYDHEFETPTPVVVEVGQEWDRRATTKDYFISDRGKIYHCGGYKWEDITNEPEGKYRLITRLIQQGKVHETGSKEFDTAWLHYNNLVVDLCANAGIEYWKPGYRDIIPAIVLLLMRELRHK